MGGNFTKEEDCVEETIKKSFTVKADLSLSLSLSLSLPQFLSPLVSQSGVVDDGNVRTNQNWNHIITNAPHKTWTRSLVFVY